MSRTSPIDPTNANTGRESGLNVEREPEQVFLQELLHQLSELKADLLGANIVWFSVQVAIESLPSKEQVVVARRVRNAKHYAEKAEAGAASWEIVFATRRIERLDRLEKRNASANRGEGDLCA